MGRSRRRYPGVPEDPAGILLVDKPSGMTSHDVVDRVRRQFRLQKVGHGGTLDPQATGLLVLLIGRGTKLSQRVMGHDKTYEGSMRLGVITDSQDADGTVLEERDYRLVEESSVHGVMRGFVGDQQQIPPMVSAVKIKGVPLYKMARKGEEVEREPRFIHVYEFRILSFEPPLVHFVLRCTKGTYVRTLCADVGEALGCGAMLESLRRTQSGNLDVANARSLEEVLEMSREKLEETITPLKQLISTEF